MAPNTTPYMHYSLHAYILFFIIFTQVSNWGLRALPKHPEVEACSSEPMIWTHNIPLPTYHNDCKLSRKISKDCFQHEIMDYCTWTKHIRKDPMSEIGFKPRPPCKTVTQALCLRHPVTLTRPYNMSWSLVWTSQRIAGFQHCTWYSAKCLHWADVMQWLMLWITDQKVRGSNPNTPKLTQDPLYTRGTITCPTSMSLENGIC